MSSSNSKFEPFNRGLPRTVGACMAAMLMLVMSSSCVTTEAATGGWVYICTGPKAKVYHSTPNCRGLKKCSGSIKKLPASSVNRRPCKVCH